MSLEENITRYSITLTALEQAMPDPTLEQVLDVLIARDAVQRGLNEIEEQDFPNVIRIVERDKRLSKYAPVISINDELDQWKRSLQPPQDYWWWYMDTPRGWGWSIFVIIIFTITVSLVINISARFLSGGPDTISAYIFVVQTVLTIIAAGGLLTRSGRNIFENMMQRIKVPKRWWQAIRVGVAVSLLLGILLLWYMLPDVAKNYNDRGLTNHLSGDLQSAINDYNRAIKLYPDYPEAHYNLGLLYEDIGNISDARTEYRIAIAGGLDAAYNNLARLYIVDEEYSSAMTLLVKGLDLTRDDETRYDIYKNLGWARLGQKRYSEAEKYLREAVNISISKAPAHCLLAQALEGMDDIIAAQDEWQTCLKYANGDVPDEDRWIDLARERLNGENR